jgi:4-methylaminobutanoate oxidase (formaldehyde-forming)
MEHTTPGTTVDVELFGTWATGVICAEPLFDPENSKIRL